MECMEKAMELWRKEAKNDVYGLLYLKATFITLCVLQPELAH